MKNIFFITVIIAVNTILFGYSCKKTDKIKSLEQLPPETQTGAFTFGCKVDGKIYTATGKGGLLADQFVNYRFYSDTTIYISIGNTVSKFNLEMNFKYTGVFGIHNTLPNQGIYQDNSGGTIPGNSNTYYTNNVLYGKINIKYFNGSVIPLLAGNILAGTFEMDAIN